jgi:hypothetical protein
MFEESRNFHQSTHSIRIRSSHQNCWYVTTDPPSSMCQSRRITTCLLTHHINDVNEQVIFMVNTMIYYDYSNMVVSLLMPTTYSLVIMLIVASRFVSYVITVRCYHTNNNIIDMFVCVATPIEFRNHLFVISIQDQISRKLLLIARQSRMCLY